MVRPKLDVDFMLSKTKMLMKDGLIQWNLSLIYTVSSVTEYEVPRLLQNLSNKQGEMGTAQPSQLETMSEEFDVSLCTSKKS